MMTSKQIKLRPLLQSKDGLHLTLYLENRGNLIDLKSQLRASINQAKEWLESVLSKDEQKKFFEPLHGLLADTRIFRNMKGNIGIFRNEKSFRILNVPVEVQRSCQVATSFHVKPLLRWLQGDQDFFLLGLQKDAAHLYSGSQDSFKLIDSMLFPEIFKDNESPGDYTSLKKARQSKAKLFEVYAQLIVWILEETKGAAPRLFVAGDKSLVNTFSLASAGKKVSPTPVLNSFQPQKAIEICQAIRKVLREESKRDLEKTLTEFKFAEESNRAKKNIFQIAKAVVQGKVRKLIVTDELNIFGKIDLKSGGLALHPMDLDHEDDCILDDLAQIVLNQGGEVVVAKRNEIPKGRPILAIIDDDGASLEKKEELQYEFLKESPR